MFCRACSDSAAAGPETGHLSGARAPSVLCTLSLPRPAGLSSPQKTRVWVASALTQTGSDGQAWLLCSGFGGEYAQSAYLIPDT